MESPAAAYLRELLLDLANDAAAYLRTHAQPAVRISAALLIAASLAACSGSPSPQACNFAGSNAAQPLTQEVQRGLPSTPGSYALQPNSLSRDGQGIYHFELASGSPVSVSRVRLAQSGGTDMLEVPSTGDPVLLLRSQASVPLCEQHGTYYGSWHPFYGIGPLAGPAYYDPPSRSVSSGSTVNGSHVSSIPSSPGDRTVGAPHTVSGRAGGTGSGSAASIKSGAGVGSAGGAAAAKAGGFSGGGHAAGGAGSAAS